MPRARVNCPLASSPSASPPACPENFGDQTQRLLHERAATAASTDNTCMVFVKDRPAEAVLPPQPYNFVDALFYIKLKATLGVIFVLEWGDSIQQYQFKEFDDRMSKFEKGQNLKKYAEKRAVELDGEISMDAKLIVNFIKQKLAAGMAKKTIHYEKKI